jgi:hypothetical protein
VTGIPEELKTCRSKPDIIASISGEHFSFLIDRLDLREVGQELRFREHWRPW